MSWLIALVRARVVVPLVALVVGVLLQGGLVDVAGAACLEPTLSGLLSNSLTWLATQLGL